jgi:GntR family transcriptional regulator
MLIKIDSSDVQLLHSQIAAGVRRAIEESSIDVGEKLPSARVLAKQLDVNMHTVLRAYDELRDEGVIQMRRGLGTTVINRGAGRAALGRLAKDFVREAERQGLSRKEMVELLEGMR